MLDPGFFTECKKLRRVLLRLTHTLYVRIHIYAHIQSYNFFLWAAPGTEAPYMWGKNEVVGLTHACSSDSWSMQPQQAGICISKRTRLPISLSLFINVPIYFHWSRYLLNYNIMSRSLCEADISTASPVGNTSIRWCGRTPSREKNSFRNLTKSFKNGPQIFLNFSFSLSLSLCLSLSLFLACSLPESHLAS